MEEERAFRRMRLVWVLAAFLAFLVPWSARSPGTVFSLWYVWPPAVAEIVTEEVPAEAPRARRRRDDGRHIVTCVCLGAILLALWFRPEILELPELHEFIATGASAILLLILHCRLVGETGADAE